MTDNQDPESEKTFGEELDDAMKEKKIGATRLSQLIGSTNRIPAPTINGWRGKNGKRPSIWEAVLQIAIALGKDRKTADRWLKKTNYSTLDTLYQQIPITKNFTNHQIELILYFINEKKTPEHRENDIPKEEETVPQNNADNLRFDIQEISSKTPLTSQATIIQTASKYKYIIALSLLIVFSAVFFSRTQAVYANTNIQIYANKKSQPTGIRVQKGQHIHITYLKGTWSIDPKMPFVTAHGYHDDQVDWSMLKTANLGSLLMRIGNSDLIDIGMGKELIADQSGEIAFQVNDGNCPCNEDNTGSVIVRLEVK